MKSKIVERNNQKIEEISRLLDNNKVSIEDSKKIMNLFSEIVNSTIDLINEEKKDTEA